MITAAWVCVAGGEERLPHGLVAAPAGAANAVRKTARAIAHPTPPAVRPPRAPCPAPPPPPPCPCPLHRALPVASEALRIVCGVAEPDNSGATRRAYEGG